MADINAESINSKAPSWTARMMAHDVRDGLPSFAPARLQSIFNALMPPETVALTSGLLEKVPNNLSLYSRGLLFIRAVTVFFRKQFLLFRCSDKYYVNAAIRKRIVYDEVVAAIENGAEQVLMLGAGFDVLCLQLHRKYPNVLFVEVDQHNTQSIKRKAIVDLCDGVIPVNYAFVSVDFRYQSLEAELQSQLAGAWKPQRKSVAVAEGVWLYLTEQAIRESLRSFKRISSAGSKYVFTYFVLGGKPMQRRLGKQLIKVFALVGEPVRYFPASQQEIEALLSTEGYQVDMSPARTSGFTRYIVPAGFDDYIKPGRVLANFIAVADSQG